MIKIEDLPAGYFPSVMAKLREEQEEETSVEVETTEEKKEDGQVGEKLTGLKVDPSRWNDISTY